MVVMDLRPVTLMDGECNPMQSTAHPAPQQNRVKPATHLSLDGAQTNRLSQRLCMKGHIGMS